MNNRGLNCAGPCGRESFSIDSAVPHNPGELNPQMWRANSKLHVAFQLQGGSLPLAPHLVQGSLIMLKKKKIPFQTSVLISSPIKILDLHCKWTTILDTDFCFLPVIPSGEFLTYSRTTGSNEEGNGVVGF